MAGWQKESERRRPLEHFIFGLLNKSVPAFCGNFRSTQGFIYTWAERGDDYHEHERMIHEATTVEHCIVACCGERQNRCPEMYISPSSTQHRHVLTQLSAQYTHAREPDGRCVQDWTRRARPYLSGSHQGTVSRRATIWKASNVSNAEHHCQLPWRRRGRLEQHVVLCEHMQPTIPARPG